MLFLQTNDTASANGTVAYDPYDVTTWTPEQIKAWWDWTFFFLGIVQDIKYFSIAVFSLVVYEYFITLDLEAELVYGWRHWKKKVWNIPNILFFINRYFIFVVLGMSNLTLFWPEPPTKFCSFAVRFNSLSGIIITIVANGSLIIRQYAFWNRSKVILWSLIVLHLGSCVGGVVAGVTGFQGITQSPKWQRGLPTGCLMTPPQHIWASFVGIMVFDVILFNLTVIQAWRLRRESGSSHSPIISHLLTSGSMYFGVMFATTAISFIAAILNNNRLAFVMTPSNILPAMTSIMCSRLLLHIRSDLKEAKTPHLRTRATADWPSSPISPDVEGMFRKMPWREEAQLDSSAAARQPGESLPQASEKLPSVVVHPDGSTPSQLGSTSTEASVASGSGSGSQSRHRERFGSSFELRGSSLSAVSTEKTESVSARW